MRALRIHAHGGVEVLRWEEAPCPEPGLGPGEVLLSVRASSINRLDCFVRSGMPGVKIPFPRILGSDAAGVVSAIGPLVRGVSVGDRVVVNPGAACGLCDLCGQGHASQCPDWRLLGENRDGAQAEFVCVPAASCVALPDGFPFEEAAAAALTGVTAWALLVEKAEVRPGETVLIHGVGSGVGVMAMQIAELCGARVIVTSSSPEKLERAKRLSRAEPKRLFHTLDYSGGLDVAKEVRNLTGKQGADVVVDYIGEATWEASLKSLRRGGRLVTCGATTGFAPREDLRRIFFRELSIHGSTMGSPRAFRALMRELFDKRIRAVIDRVLPMDRAAEGHRALEEGRVFGKVVLVPP